MSEEEQEKFEDYLELEQYIEQLHSQESARSPANLTPEQMRIYSMATLFHTASPRVADPRPEFKAQLYQRLLQQARTEDQKPTPLQPPAESAELQESRFPIQAADGVGKRNVRRIYSNEQAAQATQHPAREPASKAGKKGKMRGLSRRTLLTGGSIAASLIAGAGIGATMGPSLQPQPDLHPHIKGETWHFVATVKQLGEEPVRFATDTITGYVIRQKENEYEATETGVRPTETPAAEPIIAFSAACTHLGCIVQWQDSTRQFPCPCHGRTFNAIGNPIYTTDSQPHYLSLPRMETKIENGKIYVKVP